MGLSAAPTIPRLATLPPGLALPNQPTYALTDAFRTLVPARPLTDPLLAYAYKWTWWHHGAYHVPYFKGQVERMWASNGTDVTWGWFAMLMAILAVSLEGQGLADSRSPCFTWTLSKQWRLGSRPVCCDVA